MKVFIPVSDQMLGETGEVRGDLVPFHPDYPRLSTRHERARGRKPANWISANDYASACERLRRNSSL